MSVSVPRSLAEQLRSWPDERLATLVRHRPDLGVPAPQDSTQLASRAAARPSVLRMLDQLDRLHLTVLEAAVVLGPGCTAPQVAAIVHADPAATARALTHLLDTALLWGDEHHLRPVSVLTDLLGPFAAGAGDDVRRPVDEVRRLLGEVSPQARAMLEHVEGSGLVGTVEQADRRVSVAQARTPVEELLARRLLVARDSRHVSVPPDVVIALRGGRTTTYDVSAAPALMTSERDAAVVDRVGAGAASEFAQRVELLLETWGATPPSALRSGGVGVRDLRAATALLGVPEETTVLVIEVAAAADLLAAGPTDDLDAAWLPTDAFDTWRSQDTAQRWARLTRAWWESPRLAAVVGSKDGRGRTVNALAEGAERTWAVDTRRELLTALAELPRGSVLAATTGPPSLVAHLEWRRPRRPTGREELVTVTLDEAASLGVVALGGVTAHGAALLDGDPAGVLAPLLPPPVDHILLQADLTAVAPGPLEHELATKLATLADVESRGGATVYRFDASSIRRAFDAGWSAQEVHSFISTASRTPVPQPLVYLVDDVSRRFGTVRIGAATAFVRSDDEQALAELAHDPRAASLRLRLIAPTVLVTDAPTDVVMATLRELGVAPVLEAADGTVRLARRDTQRARTPRRRTSPGVAQARDAARVSAVVTAVRAGDRAVAARPTGGTPAPSTPAAVLSQLRDAIESGRTVWIGYTDNEGGVSERIVEPRRVDGGWLTAYDARSDDTRAFALHRITAVRSM
ncbi:helicase C-terminal domain-containing protein [Nocardioides massiliensis]|uniref:Helicase XPB/Ssl2 N-terminal domain-containing protein n=1 Tax=Nocardioides massiliensis TaxID=1325935 RepID=A0ABT9NQQ6_9ACTN|nr:helicase C-terminal domain-containing protein [Nocardioides massiliensis]MDP9822140.1 hypothetical protein [Nocardioides massiliensis]